MTVQWRLVFDIGELTVRSEWTTDFATVESLAVQYRRNSATTEVTIERREPLPPPSMQCQERTDMAPTDDSTPTPGGDQT